VEEERLDAYGHGGDMKLFRTSLTLIPERQLGIFMSFAGPRGAAAREELTTAFLDHYFPAPPVQPAPASSVAHDVAKYAGSYQWVRRNYSRIDKAFGLLSQIAVSVLPNNRLVVTSPDLDAPMQFAPLGADLFQQVGGSSQLAFRTDQSGGVTHMFFDFASFMPAERTPWYETSGLWFTLLGVSLLILLSALTGVLYGWRHIQSLPAGPRRALWLSAATAAWVFLTIIAAIVVLSVHGETFFNHIPFSFKVVLALPLLFVAMTLALIGAAIRAWRKNWWQIARRVHFTLVTLSAVILSLFFWQWNLLGWQFG
jgi:hypothetical protein